MKPTRGFYIKNCCLDHYHAFHRGDYCCMLSCLIDCSKRSDVLDECGLFACRSQEPCEACPTYHDWIASGIPAEEWIEIRCFTLSVRRREEVRSRLALDELEHPLD